MPCLLATPQCEPSRLYRSAFSPSGSGPYPNAGETRIKKTFPSRRPGGGVIDSQVCEYLDAVPNADGFEDLARSLEPLRAMQAPLPGPQRPADLMLVGAGLGEFALPTRALRSGDLDPVWSGLVDSLERCADGVCGLFGYTFVVEDPVDRGTAPAHRDP